MARRPVVFVTCILFLLLTACGSDDTSEANGNDWNLGDDVGLEDVGDDAQGDVDEADTTKGDTFDEDVDPPDDEVLSPEALIGEPWYGVFRITDDPAITGLYFSIEFVDEDTVLLHGANTRSGSWSILESEDIHLYDIEPAPGQTQPEQWLVSTDIEGDELRALEIQIPAEHIAPYSARFEQQGDADVVYDDIAGRWQATEKVVNAEGNSFYLAIRFNANELVEYGVVGQEGNFFGFISGQGYTQTFDTGHTFWALVQGDLADGHPITGEIRGDGEDRRLYTFAETAVDPPEEDDGPVGPDGPDGSDDSGEENDGNSDGDDDEELEMEIRVFELEQVEEFSND